MNSMDRRFKMKLYTSVERDLIYDELNSILIVLERERALMRYATYFFGILMADGSETS